MSVRIDHPADGAALPAGRLTVRGSGPRRATVFVNDAVTETDADGRFVCEVTLEPGDEMLVAGLFAGCPRITHRVSVKVSPNR